MKPIFATLLVLLAAGPASAEEPSLVQPYRITVPSGLTPLPDQGDAIAATLARTAQFGGLRVGTDAAAYADRERGVSLVISTVTALEASDHLAEVVGHELAAIEDAWRTATLTEGTTQSLAWKLEMSPTVADARLDYRHLANETVTYTRALLYIDGAGKLGSITAECTMLDQTVAETGPVCRQALASLALTVAPLTNLPELPSRPATPDADSTADDEELPPVTSMREPSSGTPGVLVAREQKPPSRSYRWLYVLGGLLLIAAFYLTTRSRNSERETREGEGKSESEGEGKSESEGEGKSESESEGKSEGEAEDLDVDVDRDETTRRRDGEDDPS